MPANKVSLSALYHCLVEMYVYIVNRSMASCSPLNDGCVSVCRDVPGSQCGSVMFGWICACTLMCRYVAPVERKWAITFVYMYVNGPLNPLRGFPAVQLYS